MPAVFFGGLDFGTSGARLSVIDSEKNLIYSKSISYKSSFQNPKSWSGACEILLESIPIYIKSKIYKLAISGTSGTLLACDSKGTPLGDAIPYYQACDLNKILIESIGVEEHLRTPYSSVTKALKLIEYFGEDILLRHQSDWITGWFLKDWTYGDEGNNLKLGWDLINESWPKSYSNTKLQNCLPLIVKSGKIIGQIDHLLAKRFDLNKKLLIISGTTDSNAAFLAAELDIKEGLTVLGTTLVLKKNINYPIKEKGITSHRINDQWICGGSSNTGCGILSKFFSDLEIEELSRQINTSQQTSLNLLPLNGRGERFPTNDSLLEPILSPRPVSDSLYLHALFEGLARIELKGWEKLNSLTGSLPTKIVTIGGGSRNPYWRKIREKIIKIPITTCKKTTSFGTALLASNSYQ